MIRVQCPRCKTRFTTGDANAGKTGRCPKCGNPIQVPHPGTDAASSRPSGRTSAAGKTGARTSASSAGAGAATGEAAADSALGEARRHADQAPAAGAARPEAPATKPPPPSQPPSKPPADVKPAPSETAPETGPASGQAAPEGKAPQAPTPAGVVGKSKTIALVLCILIGPMGAHRFYMGAWGYGLVILALNLTCLGSLVFTVVDVIRLAAMDNATFQARYGERVVQPFTF